MNERFSRAKTILGAALVGCLMVGGAGVVLAQDDATVVGPSRPAHIHVGDCTSFDPNPVAPLNNLEPRLNDDAEDNNAQGMLTASLVVYSESDEIEVNFEDVLATSHSIVVHESQENIQNYIACGDIGGVVVDDMVVIALHPLNDSGFTGIALLNEDGGGEVDVEAFLAEPAVDPVPEATPEN